MGQIWTPVYTGGGFATRTLYSNAEETAFDTLRPVVMNGIAGLATAQDLVDRLIRVELPPLHRRRSSAELGQEFEALRPALLGALLDLFSSTLCELPYVRLDDPPRMADFAYLGEAMFRALGRSEGFAQLYRTRQQSTALAELESSPVASAVLILMETTSRWSGPAKFLLDALASFRQDTERWPRSPRADSATPYVEAHQHYDCSMFMFTSTLSVTAMDITLRSARFVTTRPHLVRTMFDRSRTVVIADGVKCKDFSSEVGPWSSRYGVSWIGGSNKASESF